MTPKGRLLSGFNLMMMIMKTTMMITINNLNFLPVVDNVPARSDVL